MAKARATGRPTIELFQDILAQALAAEREGRVQDGLALCLRAIQLSPDRSDALSLMGRFTASAGDTSHAMTLQGIALYLDPSHAQASAELAALLQRAISIDRGKAALEAAIARQPNIAVHQRHPVSLRSFVGMDGVEKLVREALESDPSSARAHAALANILARRGERVAAMVEYRIAVHLRADFAEAHLALGALLEAAHDRERAAEHFAKATQLRQLYPAPQAERAVRRVLVLAVPGGGQKNTPLDFLVDPERTALHLLYFTPKAQALSSLPEFDVIFNAIDESESSDYASNAAAVAIAAHDKPAINRPSCVARVRRSVLPQTLNGVGGCVVPPCVRSSRDRLASLSGGVVDIEGIAFPLLIRPIDTQGGVGLERIASVSELREYLGRHDGRYFNLTHFVEYRSADAYYRKYRVVVIGGRPYPYHLAISDAWMVHYGTSLMETHEWMRAEEARFLADPRSVFRDWDRVFGEIAAAIGLDYFAVDCTVLADGAVLVFECGGAMLVHALDLTEPFAYKYEYLRHIFDAFDELLAAPLP